MQLNEWFSIAGYEKMAELQSSDGEVYVLGNNSDHFLVAAKYDEAMTDGEEQKVQLLASYAYKDEWIPAYHCALNFATTWISKLTSVECCTCLDGTCHFCSTMLWAAILETRIAGLIDEEVVTPHDFERLWEKQASIADLVTADDIDEFVTRRDMELEIEEQLDHVGLDDFPKKDEVEDIAGELYYLQRDVKKMQKETTAMDNMRSHLRGLTLWERLRWLLTGQFDSAED